MSDKFEEWLEDEIRGMPYNISSDQSFYCGKIRGLEIALEIYKKFLEEHKKELAAQTKADRESEEEL